MLLRDHPLMSYKGMPSWPPVWTRKGSVENDRPQGEVGILQAVLPSMMHPADRFFLYTVYEGSTYLGCLLIDDRAFCRQVMKLLQAHCNRPIVEIGSLELSHTL
jgi:hypothetical protein